MRRYLSHQFPNEIKTYVSLLLAGIASVIVITFFLEVSDYAQHSFKNLIGANPYLSFI
ncbi:MAG TPA: chloride channel protein, partial [Gammaproteobacteria bacterium]|nr:chloride channel protein [Gammaproteobacteria bacterium]